MSAVSKQKTIRGLREVAWIGSFVVALFCLLALATFNPEDAGWSHSGSSQSISNAGGVVGAWVSDLSFSIFGLMAYLFPLMFLWHGYLIYTLERHPRGALLVAIRWLGFIATLVAGCAIFYLYISRLRVDLPGGTGGILGEELSNLLLVILGNSGAGLLFLAVFLVGITLLTGLSWLSVIDFVGRCTLWVCRVVYQWSLTFYGTSRAYRQQTKARAAKPSAAKITPKITTESPLAQAQDTLDLFTPRPNTQQPVAQNRLPPLDLLARRRVIAAGYSKADLAQISDKVEDVLQDFNIIAEVVSILPGPVITRFELQLAAGIKVSRVSGLAKDIARGLSVTSVRIVDVIHGKSVIGLEIPNREREMVSLRDLIASANFIQSESKLTFAMGKDIAGVPLMADLGKMPHVLVAGTTGSGKSVAINTMVLSLLYKSTPDDVRLIMIDPKMLELSVYEGIPHLLTPVVTDMKNAKNALCWAVAEMERRYRLMSKLGVRNLVGYNRKITDAQQRGEPIRDPLLQVTEPLAEGEEFPVLTTLPSIVIFIDELADMMMIVGKKVEELIARLAQKARAAGIHLVLATQRPSVDVLTGLIKANVPTRISFQVSSRIDSRTILDQGGAETLLGNGDMLFLPSGTSIPIRAHGAFVDDYEVHSIVDFLKQTAPANYLPEITQEYSDSGEPAGEQGDAVDVLYDEAVMFVTDTRKASISSVQRQFKIGYNRAARIIEEMESAGVVSRAEGNGSREVLAAAAPKA